MKLAFTLILISLFFSSNFAQNKSNKERVLKGFRGIEWGASKSKVKSNVKDYYLQEFYGFGVEALCYKGTIAGIDARIDYNFENNKLVDGLYSIKPESLFRENFRSLKNYLINEYGKPDFKVGTGTDSSSVWIKENNYGKFRGPEFYWSFKNGFVGLHASKFKDDITITVLYVQGKTIKEFNKENLVPLK
jgi:hypothetical protein